MTTTIARGSVKADAASARKWLDEISREAKPKPSAIICNGNAGIGKTSVGAATIRPVFLIDDQEDGINTLKTSALVDAKIPVLPPATEWSHVIGQLDALAVQDHEFGTLVVDTLGGMERLCHTFICDRDFGGNWGEKGFTSYAKGYEVALPEWRRFLSALDRLRQKRGMMIFGISHSLVRPFKNPTGEDYDRYVADMHRKTWAITEKWADIILFLNYFVAIDKGKTGRERPKGKGGKSRIMHTEYEAAFDAKNRHNLPATIEMGGSGGEAWCNLVSAIKSGKAK